GVLHHDTTAENLDQHADFHILELTDIEVPAFRTHRPAEEEVASRLHKTVPVHYPLAMVGIHAFSSIGLQDRRACFFHLEEEWILFAGQEEHDSAPGADATDADHLDRDIVEFVTVQEPPPVFLHGFPIAGKSRLDAGEKFPMTVLAPMIDERRIVFNGRQPANNLRKLGKIVFKHAAMASRLQSLPQTLAGLRVFYRWNQVCDIHARIPHVQDPHLAEFGHALAIRSNAGEHRIPRAVFAKAVVATGDNKACGQALYVPLPGGWQGFVKIVDIEDFPSLRRGEHAEVQQMSVAAGLYAEPGSRRARQVRGHIQRRASIERKRRLHHASVANGDELGNTSLV